MSTSKETIDNSYRDWRIYFYLPLEILDKTKLFLWKFCKTVLRSLGIPKPKTRSLEIINDFFLITIPFFSQPLNILYAIPLIPIEIS